jgi:hypothetical protein
MPILTATGAGGLSAVSTPPEAGGWRRSARRMWGQTGRSPIKPPLVASLLSILTFWSGRNGLQTAR